jgi:Asp-tRNA(Asn)/Glu-tRNA(Gln) amidotransferase A subunit family amidase
MSRSTTRKKKHHVRIASVSKGLVSKSANELSELIRSRIVSPVEVIESYLHRIDQINPSLNAIVTLAPDVLDQARARERALTQGSTPGPLHGVPVTLKDTIATAGIRTTSGSRLLSYFVPEVDALVVARLKTAGAIILGKTNTSEMAIPYETDNPLFGRTNNPYDLNRTAGGSSGGEAAAIAAHLSPAGVGSDLSGSIRVPAHFCGIAGLKPTTGLLSMDGHIPQAVGRLALGACVGPMARRVIDLTLLLNVMADAAPVAISESDLAERSRRQLRGLRVAYYSADGPAPVSDETVRAVEMAAKALAEAGLQVRAERAPGVSEGSRLWVELFSGPAKEQLREFYQGREDEAGPRVGSILRKQREEPTFDRKIETAERTAQAVVARERQREELIRWMRSTPLILAPVAAIPAFEHGADRVNVEGESISTFRAFSYSQTFNVFGFPAVSVPVARSSEGLPIGVQIVGRPFEEDKVLAAAAIIEQSVGLL